MSWLLCLMWLLGHPPEGHIYAIANIEQQPEQAVLKLKQETDWWLELGDRLLLRVDQAQLAQKDVPLRVLQREIDADKLRLLPVGCGRNQLPGDVELLTQTKRFALLQVHNQRTHILDQHGHLRPLLPVQNQQVVQRLEKPVPVPQKRLAFRSVQHLVDEVDADRWFADVTQLASWNRYARGPEIDQARDWLVAQFEAMPGLQVSTQEFTYSGTTAYNVIAVLPGTFRPDDWYVVGAHYDSTSESPNSSAPGAEDNASGTAAVLEMARIVTANRAPEGTIIFICYSGEEQGLHGSIAHVNKLTSDGDLNKLKTVITMDMIGYSEDETLDCLLETRGGVGDDLLPIFSNAAAAYTDLRITTSLFAFGSDHIPYLNANIPTLLTIENDYGSYPGYHRTNDTPEKISLPMGREIIKMNIAVLAQLAGAAVDDTIFQQYASNWDRPPTDNTLDSNGNNRIDVTEIVLCVQ